MSSSTSNSKILLFAAFLTLIGAAYAVQFIDKSYIHTGPEYAMSEAVRERIEAVCKQAHVDLVIVGDSRAVAAVDSGAIRAKGYSVEKFALGGSGVFVGWAVLDRLSRCPVKIDNVLMSYGQIHALTPGALMERTTNFGFLRGPEAAPAYRLLSQIETRRERRVAYGAIGALGTKLTFAELVLQRPALKTLLRTPAHALENRAWYVEERPYFLAHNGDVYYGRNKRTEELPDEGKLNGLAPVVDPVARAAAVRIASLARAKHYRVMFYVTPDSDVAWKGLDRAIFARTEDFIALLHESGIDTLNHVWRLPDDHFGDPNHVNPRGRAAVTADLLPRIEARLGAPAASP